MADDVRKRGGEVRMNAQATGLRIEGGRVVAVKARDAVTGAEEWLEGDFVFSTMPVKELIAACEPPPPPNVREVAAGLVYRDFVTIGLLLRKLAIRNETRLPSVNDIVPDNWIYIQEREVKLGRLQIFNNWSPYMVADPVTAWIGLVLLARVTICGR
ncbi:MAG: hypothetical protein IPI34_15025 [bacterium]|nr:hypothetical protein [bacterium]